MKELLTLEGVDNAVLDVLFYYSLFKYPLTLREIHKGCQLKCSIEMVDQAVKELLARGEVYEHGNFFSPSPNVQSLVTRRLCGNELAQNRMAGVRKAAAMISRFPFVRFVGVSGSLSKGYAEADSDFDFFIITRSNRLWICRTILHLFKKLTFFVGQEDHFCMNYFVDEECLTLTEKNRYTATELATLVPVYGKWTYDNLMKSNKWLNSQMPNGLPKFIKINMLPDTKNSIKHFFEKVIDSIGANYINKLLMKITDWKWRRKWKNKGYPMADYDLAFKTTLHISKNHPANYQKQVLKQLAQNRRAD